MRQWSTIPCFVLLLAVSLGGCGGGSSSDVVARVAGVPITKTSVAHWRLIAPDDPPPSSSTTPTTARQRALQFLISAQWTIGQARELGATVNDAEARKRLERFKYAQLEGLKYEHYSHEAELERSLARPGESTADQILLMKLNLLRERIDEKRRMEVERQIPQAEIAEYYAKHKARFVVPERRDFNIILTYSKAKTEKARREIEAGKPFLSVAKRVSVDPEAPHGTQHLTRYEEEPEFVAHVFAAKLHTLVGPIHQAADYYLFELTKITPSRQRTLSESRATIASLLGGRRYRSLSDSLAGAAEDQWRARTSCAPEYVAPQCGRAQHQ